MQNILEFLHGFAYKYFSLNDIESVANFIKQIEPKNVQFIFLAPFWIAESISKFNFESEINEDILTIQPAFRDLSVTPQKNLNGYIPKNNKLLTFPFCYILISNNQGSDAVLKQEIWNKFEGDEEIPAGDMLLRMYGALTPGCSIRAVPIGYNGDTNSINTGINLGKFPQISWNSDAFTNWLTQNGVNIATSLAGLAVTAVSPAAGMAFSASKIALSRQNESEFLKANNEMNIKKTSFINNASENGYKARSVIENSMTQMMMSQFVPNQVEGNINNGDLMTALGENALNIYKMSIKKEYAKIIDDYFTKFGYKVNTVKKANITGRKTFNYIEIGDGEILGFGDIPPKFLESINNIAKSGVTIWHNHDEIGNFNLDNSIIN